jgi:hypothetical protein
MTWQGVATDSVVPAVMEVASEVPGIKISFHLEPYPGKEMFFSLIHLYL